MLIFVLVQVRGFLYRHFGQSVLAPRAAVEPIMAKGIFPSGNGRIIELVAEAKKGKVTKYVDSSVYKSDEAELLSILVSRL